MANPKDINDAGSNAFAALSNVWDPEKLRYDSFDIADLPRPRIKKRSVNNPKQGMIFELRTALKSSFLS